MDLHSKYETLKAYLKEQGSVAVAFSGGVDSTFLLKTAHQVLGSHCMAVTACSPSFPERELLEAEDFCRREGIMQVTCPSKELQLSGFSHNPPDRCYLCKKEILSMIREIARQHQMAQVAEGSNLDDLRDYRPGLRAITELGVISPLKSAGLTKQEIRELSREQGLSIWDKPAFACLLSRFPYGQEITPERLRMIERAERFLLDLGLKQVRVRYHGDLARIETDEAGFSLLKERGLREAIQIHFKSLGFTYTALDLLGYRMGSMNETLLPSLSQK